MSDRFNAAMMGSGESIIAHPPPRPPTMIAITRRSDRVVVRRWPDNGYDPDLRGFINADLETMSAADFERKWVDRPKEKPSMLLADVWHACVLLAKGVPRIPREVASAMADVLKPRRRDR